MPETSIPLFPLLAALVGLVLGSFYTACVHRYIHEMSLVHPARSLCPGCGHALSWWENVPLLSYALLRGRCRHCGMAISARYPAMELLSGVFAVLLAWRFGPSAQWAVYMAFTGIFLVASFIDLELYILPDRLTIGGTLLALVCAVAFLGEGPLWQRVQWTFLGLLAGGGFFWLLQQFYRIVRRVEGVGTGDVKLMCLIGALVGPAGLPLAVTAAAVSALVASVFWLLAPGARGMHTRVPFGPFLCLGALVQVLWGDAFWAWYLRAVAG